VIDAEFSIWLENGIKNGWISPPVCSTHDGVPLTELEEDTMFYDSNDVCVYVSRLYESQAQRLEVERNNCPIAWRRSNEGWTTNE